MTVQDLIQSIEEEISFLLEEIKSKTKLLEQLKRLDNVGAQEAQPS